MKRLFWILVVLALVQFSCERQEEIDPMSGQEMFSGEADQVAPGKYIVLIKGGVSDLKSTVQDPAVRLEMVREEAAELLLMSGVSGRTPDHVYASVLRGFALELEREEAAALGAQPGIEGIWEDRIIILKKPGTTPSEPPAQTTPYGITRVGGPSVYTGNNVAWIIDTGIDYDHPDLNVDVGRSKSFVTRTSTADDDNGHGTHCAGIVAAKNNDIGVVGVAAGATVVAVKVLNRRGSGYVSEIIAGMDHVAAYASAGDVANISLGGGGYEPLDLAAVRLGEAGVRVAMAAGNESDDANNHSPARANGTNLFTVSAMDANDVFAYFSNYGNPPVDFCAPGMSIQSTYKNGGYATMSGTSMAAPHVCGILLATGKVNSDGVVKNDPDGEPDLIAHK